LPKKEKEERKPRAKKGKGFWGFISSPPVRRLLLLIIIAALIYWFRKPLVSLGINLWEGMLGLFGAGLILLAAAIGAFIWIIVQRELAPFFRHWNKWLGAVALAVALWGLLAFFAPGDGIVSRNSLGGDVGRSIIGSPSIIGVLRVVGLTFLGILFIAPRGVGRAIAAFFKALWRGIKGLWRLAFQAGRAAPKPEGKPPIIREAEVKEEVPQVAAPETAKAEARHKVEGAPVLAAGGWQLPPIDILDKPTEVELSQADIEKRAQLIEEALLSYGVEAKVVQINVGPSVTQFGVEPGWDHKYKEIRERDKDDKIKVRLQEVSKTRVKVERITSLANDLALALAAPAIRIEAPVPGKPVVGIEVPNTTFGTVNLRSAIETSVFQKIKAKSNLALALGKGAGGETVAADLSKMPHLLIAGATGSGKTACLNSTICCLLLHNTPYDVKFIMLDPKRVELVPYNSIPHLVAPVVVDTDKAIQALRWLMQEMDHRYRQFAQVGARNIEGYNRDKPPEESMPYLVLIIDELADLMMVAFDEVEHTLCRLAQLARATGIHLVVATQRPSVDVVTGLIKANFPTRISFAVTSQVDSRTILDTIGAEKLLGRGDMLFMPTEATKPKRLQGSFITDAEIERIVSFWGNQYRPDLAPIRFEEAGVPFITTLEVPPDALLEAARRLAQEHKYISTSFLQRRLRIGYPRAARLMELLEEEGFGREKESRQV